MPNADILRLMRRITVRRDCWGDYIVTVNIGMAFRFRGPTAMMDAYNFQNQIIKQRANAEV